MTSITRLTIVFAVTASAISGARAQEWEKLVAAANAESEVAASSRSIR